MIAHTTWRDLFYKLAEAHPDCLMLNFTVKVLYSSLVNENIHKWLIALASNIICDPTFMFYVFLLILLIQMSEQCKYTLVGGIVLQIANSKCSFPVCCLFLNCDLYLRILAFWCSMTFQSAWYVPVTGKECSILLCSEIYFCVIMIYIFCYIFIDSFFCSVKDKHEFHEVYAEANLTILCVLLDLLGYLKHKCR